MDWIIKLFDLFNNGAKWLAAYIPQSGEDVIQMFGNVGNLAAQLNIWVNNNIGLNIQTALAPIGRLVVLASSFLIDLIKQIVHKIS